MSLGSESDDTCALARAVQLARTNQARLTALAVVDELPAGTMLRGMALTTDTLQKAMVEASTYPSARAHRRR